MEQVPKQVSPRSFWSQGHENEEASFVIMHRPDFSVFIANLHPCGALFEVPVNLKEAKEAHKGFEQLLKTQGLEVKLVKDILLQDCETNPSARKDLEDLAFKHLHYVWSSKGQPMEASGFSGDEYKRKVIEAMDSRSLVNMILCNPTVVLKQAKKHTPVSAKYTFSPLGNLVFTRDQQICTVKGIVLANLRPHQRRAETEVMKLCFKKLGVPIIGEIPDPLTLEGGDFLPAGHRLCFIGAGPRTNEGGVAYMLEQQMFGTKHVAVVRDIFDRRQQRMHLDTIFNIASDNCVLLLETVIGRDSLTRRLVNEYTLKNGKYVLTQTCVEFSEYLQQQGFHVLKVSEEYQLGYAINFINLGGGQLVTAHEGTKQLLEACPYFKGNVLFIPYRGVTTMYGGPHCSTQVFRKYRADPSIKPKRERKAKSATEWLNTAFPGPAANRQTTSAVLMIAPTEFTYNSETAKDNKLMSKIAQSRQETQHQALLQYSELHRQLVAAGVMTHLFTHEPYHQTPEAIFTNNWLTSHTTDTEKTLVLYPIKATSRRTERRPDLIQYLRQHYTKVEDLSGLETHDKFLEGAGSLVLDRVNKVAYSMLSERTSREAALEWAQRTGYEVVLMEGLLGSDDIPISHTDMILSIGTSFAVICEESITSETERGAVVARLRSTGRTVIPISFQQVKSFCGNILELRGVASESQGQGEGEGQQPRRELSVLFMSSTAYHNFTQDQRETLAKCVDKIVHVDISLIETVGGGGVRSCLAELF
jgi:arginine deiminase